MPRHCSRHSSFVYQTVLNRAENKVLLILSCTIPLDQRLVWGGEIVSRTFSEA